MTSERYWEINDPKMEPWPYGKPVDCAIMPFWKPEYRANPQTEFELSVAPPKPGRIKDPVWDSKLRKWVTRSKVVGLQN